MANIIFVVVSVLIVGGLVIWVSIVVRRANAIDRNSSFRIDNDLAKFVLDPQLASEPSQGVSTAQGPAYFSDDLPGMASTAPVTAPTAGGPAKAETVAADSVETDTVATPDPAPVVLAAPAASVIPQASPTTELEAKLAKLDDLHGRGVITDAEHTAARLTALSE